MFKLARFFIDIRMTMRMIITIISIIVAANGIPTINPLFPSLSLAVAAKQPDNKLIYIHWLQYDYTLYLWIAIHEMINYLISI